MTLLACALALALTASPAAASGIDVIRDCTDNGRIDDTYGPRDYQEALGNLPSDVEEYTDCRGVISAASRRSPSASASSSGGDGGGGGSSGGSGGSSKGPGAGSAPSTPQGPHVVPPESTLSSKPLGGGIPTPVILTLVLLALALIVALLVSARNRGMKLPIPVLRVVDRVFPRRA